MNTIGKGLVNTDSSAPLPWGLVGYGVHAYWTLRVQYLLLGVPKVQTYESQGS